MSFRTSSAPTHPLSSMSNNLSNARNASSNSPVKMYHKTPGSNGIPMSGVLLQKGVTQKTASTARKSASIGNADSPLFSGKATSALRRPSEDHSSDSASTPRGKLMSAGSLSTTKSAQVAKKRKRPPFYQSEDDMVRSDLVGTRPGKVVGNTSGLSTVVNKSQSFTGDKQSNANSNTSPAALQPRDVVTTVTSASATIETNLILSRSSSGPTIVDLDPPDAISSVTNPNKAPATPKESISRLRHMKKKQKTVQSTLNFRRPSIPSTEVITIDDSDDDSSPAAASQYSTSAPSTPVALVEAAGEAAIIPTEEVRRSTFSAQRPSSFTQRVRGIKERLSISEATKTPGSASILTSERPQSRNGIIPAAKSLSKPALKAHEIDAGNITKSDTGNALEGPLPVTEAPSIEEPPQQEASDQLSMEHADNLLVQSSPAPMPSISTSVSSEGLVIYENKETEIVAKKSPEPLNDCPADIIIQESATQEIAIFAEKEARVGSPSLQLSVVDQATPSGSEDVQTSPEEGTDARQVENRDKEAESPSISSKDLSRETVDTTPLQSHSMANTVELDPNMPGARGRVVREYMELEDKYARVFREQARLQPYDRTYVNHDFFSKCIDPLLIPREELECMVHKLENTIFMLYEEASQYIISQQFYRITAGVLLRGRIDEYFLSDRLTLSLDQRLRKLLHEITVMTFSHSKIMFEAWVAAGQQPLEGKIVLSTESILELVENHKRVSAEIEQDDRIAAENGDEDHVMDNDMDHGLAIDGGQCNLSGLDSGEDHTRDVEMTDAVGEAVDNLSRRNSLIVKLAAPPTVLRELDRTKSNHAVPAAVTPQRPMRHIAPIAPPGTTFAFTVPPPPIQALDPSRPPKPNARAKSFKGKDSGESQINSIMEQMKHFGDSRVERIKWTVKEQHDPHLRCIRQLDHERDKIRDELRQLTEEAARKTAEFDKRLALLLHEADFLDQEAKLNGLGSNGYLPPDRDLKWEQYERLHREKADHETDTAAAREKLIRRGHSIHEEKRRAHAFYQESLEFEQMIEARKKEFEQTLLMNPYQHLGASSYTSSSNSTPSTRETSAAIGALADRPALEGVAPDSSESSGPSSIFSEEAVSTPATVAPDRPIINKAAAFRSMRSLFENNLNDGFGSGYGNMLLIGIRDAAMLEAGEAPPATRTAAQLLAADAARKKKKRPVKGW
ncbi:hypothetical protein EV426DRAFT_289660 [Tirmania nivea]|nr:hypothetical protein EV426DRAFT_289660 [Tirmania nivea]